MKITKFIKDNILLVIIILFGSFLRLYKLAETFIVIPETGQDLIIAREAILSNSLPLHGVISSHIWLYFGPLYWWILKLFLFFSSFDPLSHAVLGRIGSILIVVIVYLFVKRISNKRTALFALLLTSISPLFMMSARVGRHDSFSCLFSLLLLYVLSFSDREKIIKPFLIGLILGAGINIEYTFIPMGLVVISFMLIRKIKPVRIDLIKILIGFIIPFLPLILLEVVSGQQMLAKMVLWVPYRVLGFMGLIKSDIEVEGFADVSYSIWKLIPDSFFYNPSMLLGSILIIVVLSGFFILIEKLKQDSRPVGGILLILVTLVYMLGLIIHTNPPQHYFSEIYFVPIVLLCLMSNYIWSNKLLRIGFLCFCTAVVIVNIRLYFSPNWFYKNYLVDKSSYVAQKEISRKIITDAGGRPYSFERVGLFDDRKNYFADNYLYLLWYEGNPPVKNAAIKYIIYDGLPKSKNEKGKNVGSVGTIRVVKVIK